MLKRRPTFRYWRELERSQWLSGPELQARQLTALRRLLSHAHARSPYYREAWAALGLDAESLHGLADLARWPVLERETVRAERPRMRAAGFEGRLIAKATGGSSGVPLQFDLDHESNDRRMAAWHRGYGWAGATPGTKQFYLWGVALGDVSARKRRKDALYHWLYRREVANCFEFRDELAPQLARRLARCRPDAIVAYTNPLYSWARALEEQGVRPWSPASIVVGAEKLHAFQRELIERVFRAPVFETYGSREFMLIAAECERHAGLHVTAENLLVEVIDADGRPVPAGEEGDLVVTDLTNYGLPFIRYRTGDRAVASDRRCDCGRGLPLLERVVGRQLDMLTTLDGRQLPGEFFPHLLKEFPAIRRFQVVQQTPERITLRLVARGDWTTADGERVEREVRSVAGQAFEFEIVQVEDIPLTSAGKLQVVVNHVPRPTAAPHGETVG
jgi:phenylacetate-CoA ligase